MRKYIFLVILLFAVGCTKQKTHKKIQKNNDLKHVEKTVDNSLKTDDLVDLIYGSNGANLALDQIFAIQDTIESIKKLSQQEQQQVAAATVRLLQEDTREQSELQKMVNLYLIQYLKDFAVTSHEEDDFTPNIIDVAKKIVNYITIEQDAIFNNQKTKQLFLIAIQNRAKQADANNENHTQTNQLPSLINFWVTPMGEKILNNYDESDPTKIQWVGNMVRDMGIAVLAQQGASMANAQIGVQAENLIAKIGKDSQIVQAHMQSFQTKSQKNQQDQLQSMMTSFSDAQKDVQTKTARASAISKLELDYLYKNISMSQPQQNYIFNQIEFDQLFTQGTMLTPEGMLWKNPFSVGDWEYEKESNSFWQYQSSPLFNSIKDDDGKASLSSLQAENNAIFTEYNNSAASYAIAGSISLYHIDYPFFAGIIFNKARWISGDFESIRKCRMIAIYGSSANDIGVYFAQQYTMSAEQLKATNSQDPIQTPLQQIINNKVDKQINLPNDTFANLHNEPTIFNYEITNAPTTVSVKLWIADQEPMTFTVNNLDSSLYRYHGVGFICPSAVAQFTITQPQDLIFTVQAISNYKD